MKQEFPSAEVATYTDNKLQKLKQELKSLEQKFQSLSEQKIEYLEDIDDFNLLHSIKLGPLVQKIFELKEQILKEALKNSKKLTPEEEKIAELKRKIRKLRKEMKTTLENSERYHKIIQEYTKLKKRLDKLQDQLRRKEQKEQFENGNRVEDDKIKKRYEEIKSDFEDFNKEYEEVKQSLDDKCEIDAEEAKELKKLYKKASRICHPDLVIDEYKSQATEIMKSLNEAKSNNNITKVREILSDIENGIIFKTQSDSISNLKILEKKIEEFLQSIENLENDIKEIQDDEIFIEIQNIDNMNEYFKLKREELEEEYEYIKKNRVVN